MLANFKILGSSSSGNCAFLQTGQTLILIDAGFSAKRIAAMLEVHGKKVERIDAVFLTHEHSDHSRGIRGLSRFADLPIFANRDTADAVQSKLTKRPNWQIFETGKAFSFRDIEIRSFSLPHDAYDPVGYTFRWGEKDDLLNPRQGLAWVTDLGYIPSHVQEHIREVETLVIEANYDEALLEKDTRRPWATKQRIRGRHGHLSNDAVLKVINSLNGRSALREIYLAHLSPDCNTVDRVKQTFLSLHDADDLTINIIDPASSM